MSIRCPGCGREFDVTVFEFDRAVRCPCGREVSLANGHREEIRMDWESLEKEIFANVDRRECDAIRREADRISSLILSSDMPRIDIENGIRAFREKVLRLHPDKEDLFESLYVNRFRRLWAQFRDSGQPLLPENRDGE